MKLDDKTIMSVDLICQLSCFLPLREFVNHLKRERIFLGEKDDSPLFVKYASREPRGLKPWKGLK
jgi:hypothetical protein